MRHGKERPRSWDRKPWTHRLDDGRLRAQCRPCYESSLPPAVSIAVCAECGKRNDLRRSEIAAFKARVEADDRARASGTLT